MLHSIPESECNLLQQAVLLGHTLSFNEIVNPQAHQASSGIGSSVKNDPIELGYSSFTDISHLSLVQTDPSLLAIVREAGGLLSGHLRELALGSEYEVITGLAFGEDYHRSIAESLRQSFAEGNLAKLPHIQILDADILNNANGAYASEINTIFLSNNFVSNHSLTAITKVLLEEVGHFIDSQINEIDTAGDEGDIFSRLVLGQNLCLNELAYLKQEDDSGYVWFNGHYIAVEQDNTLSTAYGVGTLSGSRSLTGWVGNSDFQDYFRFSVGTTINFRLALTGLSSDADVHLLDSAGNTIQSSYLGDTNSEVIARQLRTGTYYAVVYQFSGDTSYNLSLRATATLLDNSLSEARGLGNLVGTSSFTDWIGSNDAQDYYRFNVSTASNFRLSLTGLNADANVQLLNSSGNIVQSSQLSGTSSELIARQLSAGTYYARVYRFSGNTTYNLALSATAITLPDLVIQSQYSPNTTTLGSTVTVNQYTHNQGNATARDSYVHYWLSNDTTLNTGSDRYLGRRYVGSLASGSSEYDSFSFIYNSDWGTGTRYILFKADGENWASESNESNNLAYRSITVNGTSSYIPSTYRAFNASQVFALHSHAGANHTIYLDFNGHTTQNTMWNSHYARSSIVTPAYDTDSNNTSFSTDERRNIWTIWQRVAEDFIPFNVNVTTAAPPLSDLIKGSSTDTRWGVRVVIGGNGSWSSGQHGGLAYDSFNWNSDTPAFIFSRNFYSERHIAEAVSHEVGHTLGLSHDGKIGGSEYYPGHNGWASIMGVGYTQNLTQWSKGQYSNASNREDDLAIITGNNGFGYRADDYGSSLNHASNLIFNGSTVRTYGIIERNTDVDWFKLTSSGGNLALNINAFETGANLDILVKLYNSAGQVIATYNPSASLSVIINRYLNLGTYYLSIQGTGKGDLITGYSAYGSLGQYLVTGTIA